ncbi:hypothetical protein ACWKT5_33405 [Streptomyces avermitilis]
MPASDAIPALPTISARPEAFYPHPSPLAPVVQREPDPVPAQHEHAADRQDTSTCASTPGNCWGHDGGEDKEQYAKVENHDGVCVLSVVDDFTEGMVPEPTYVLDVELPTGSDWILLGELTTLAELAQTKLDEEGWCRNGPWHVWWEACVNDLTEASDLVPGSPPGDEEATDADAGSPAIGKAVDRPGSEPPGSDQEDGPNDRFVRSASISRFDDGYGVVVATTGGEEQQEVRLSPNLVPDGEYPGTGSLEELRSLVEQASRRLHEAGYDTDGDWSVSWQRCHNSLDIGF